MNVNIRLSKKVFNDVYLPFLDNEDRYLVFYGGGSSGKSYFIAQRYVYKLIRPKRCNILVVRQTGDTNRRSTFPLFKQVISNWGLTQHFKINESDMRIVCKLTGNEVAFAGLDDVEKIKSITFANGELTDIWVEEATEEYLVSEASCDLAASYAKHCSVCDEVLVAQEVVDDLLLGFGFREAQGHELGDLFAGDLADGGLVDQLCLGAVGHDGGDGLNLGIAHDDGVALHMAEAGGITHHAGVEDLLGIVLSHGTGDHAALGVHAVQHDFHITDGRLLAVSQQTLGDDHLAACLADKLGKALGGVDAADLHGFQRDAGAFLQIEDGLGVQDPLAGAFAFTIVLFHIGDLGVFAHIEGVDTVVLGIAVAAVVNTAACHDLHIGVLADEEIIVDEEVFGKISKYKQMYDNTIGDVLDK